MAEAPRLRQAAEIPTSSRLQKTDSADPADQSTSSGGAGSDEASEGDADSSGDSAGQEGQEKKGTPFSRAFATIMAQDADILEVIGTFDEAWGTLQCGMSSKPALVGASLSCAGHQGWQLQLLEELVVFSMYRSNVAPRYVRCTGHNTLSPRCRATSLA